MDKGLSCAIIGGPKSGKTILAKNISKKFNLVYLTPSSVIDWCFSQQACNNASNEVRKVIASGKKVDAQLFVQVLQQRVTTNDCVTKGYVLDGFPRTLQEAELMTEGDLVVPKLVFQLQMLATDTMLRASNDNKTAVQATINGLKADDSSKSGSIIKFLGQWRRDESLITTLFKRKYENIKPLQASVSQFSLANDAFAKLRKCRACYGEYTNSKWNARPAPLAGVAIMQKVFIIMLDILGCIVPFSGKKTIDFAMYVRIHAAENMEWNCLASTIFAEDLKNYKN